MQEQLRPATSAGGAGEPQPLAPEVCCRLDDHVKAIRSLFCLNNLHFYWLYVIAGGLRLSQ